MLDTSTEKLTPSGHYRLSIRPNRLPIPLRELHDWIVHVELPDGRPTIPGRLDVGGGMPAHGHGFPSQPAVTRHLGRGDFLIEGVKFNMAGHWQLSFRVDAPGPESNGAAAGLATETVTFDLDIRDAPSGASTGAWEDRQLDLLRSLSISALPARPGDPSNRVATDESAQALGRRLFFDTGLSSTGTVSCASCHDPKRHFTDGLTLSKGLGTTARHAPSLLGVAWSSWFYWDGRRDSLWAQALTPLESLDEMGGTRMEVVRHVVEQPELAAAYEATFGARPRFPVGKVYPQRAGPFAEPPARDAWHRMGKTAQDRVDVVFANIGKAIAAYESTLVPTSARFDRYVETLSREGPDAAAGVLTSDELAGLRLFVDESRTHCLRCHNGPLLTNFGFHDIGTGRLDGPVLDFGREVGLQAALIDPFNCAGKHSDCPPESCRELRFLERGHAGEMRGAFKVPSLRNVAATAPYMHDGRFADLESVIAHYADKAGTTNRSSELPVLELTKEEIGQLVAFLGTLTGE